MPRWVSASSSEVVWCRSPPVPASGLGYATAPAERTPGSVEHQAADLHRERCERRVLVRNHGHQRVERRAEQGGSQAHLSMHLGRCDHLGEHLMTAAPQRSDAPQRGSSVDTGLGEGIEDRAWIDRFGAPRAQGMEIDRDGELAARPSRPSR